MHGYLLVSGSAGLSRHAVRVLGRHAVHVLASAGDDDAPDEPSDLDREWQRWRQEGLAESGGAPTGVTPDEIEMAQSEVWDAELALLSARQERLAAMEAKARLEDELEELERERSELPRVKLPYEFEEIEAVQRYISDADNSGFKSVAVAAAWAPSVLALGLVLVQLLLRWRTDGPEGAAGCLLVPLACITGQV